MTFKSLAPCYAGQSGPERMDRDTFRRRLAETEEQLANGLSHIAQQCKLIVELESNGRPTDHARYLLAGLELLQAARRDSRDWLWKQLNKNTSRAKI